MTKMNSPRLCIGLLFGCLTTLAIPAHNVLANDAPPTVTASVTASQTVQVTWAEPAGVAGYVVVPVVGSTEISALEVQKAAGQTGHLFEELTNGTTYAFRVRAVYSDGVSDFKQSNAVTPAGPPTAPSGVTVTPGDGQLEVSWTPSDANGSPLQPYSVSLSSGASVVATKTTTSTSVSFTNLVNETTYSVAITAANAAGSSVSTDQSGTPTAGVAPPSPVEAVAGNNSVNLLWTPPIQTGGEDVDSYTIEITAPVSAASSKSVAGSASTYTWTGLSAGTEYTFRMKTINVLNAESAWSVTVQATPTSPTQGGSGGGDSEDESTAPAGRIGGVDRFETAVLIAQSFFSPGVDVVYLATGAGFADALAGGPATKGDGPILLVRQNEIPSSTATELTRLNPGRIVVLGGEAAVSAEVLEAAREYTSGEVTRIGGTDRYETAVQASLVSFAPGVEVAYIATGLGFADALSAGPTALGDGPILLVRQNEIPSSTATELTRLNPGRIVVLGGESAVSAAVLEAAREYTSGEVTRIGGTDRYETSALVSASRFSPGESVVFIATGEGYADALSAGPVGAPVLLARATCVPNVVLDEIARLSPVTVTVLGGMSALGSPVRNLTACA